MLNRRELLTRTTEWGFAATIGAAIGCSGSPSKQKSGKAEKNQENQQGIEGVVLNDKQSQLNATRVKKVVSIKSTDDTIAQLKQAARDQLSVSVAGGRHAMGGQQFGEDTIHFDTSQNNRVLSFDREKGLIRVQGGMNWLELLEYLHTEQSMEPIWTIKQKQTGVDRVSIAGTLSANAHGRGLQFQPIVGDVESLLLILADGTTADCSRRANPELFQLAIGGYGLFGIIAEVTLRLVRRTKVERTVKVIDVKDLLGNVEQRIQEGYLFGDCQYSTDFSDLDAPHRGVFSCYKPVEVETIPPEQRKLSAKDWTNLIHLAHIDKKKAFDTYADYYLKTNGQIYWSDTHQLSNNFDGYHAVLDKQMKSKHKGSEMITEVYVRRENLSPFLRAARKAVHEQQIEIIYGTIRFIEKDDVTFLPWAKEQSVCILCNLHVDHSEEGIAKAARDARTLIQIALDHGGRYFPTYHRWATKKQVLAAYPQFGDFLKLKKKHDPQDRLQSDWYRHYKKMFA